MQAVCQHTAISLCVWVQLICNLSLSDRALSKLVVSSLYSYINVRLLSAYVLLQLNCCPLETTSLFVEESLRFCLDSDCNDTVTDVRQVATDLCFFFQTITGDCHFITNRLHVIVSLTPFIHKLIADSSLTPSYPAFVTVSSHQSCTEDSNWLWLVADLVPVFRATTEKEIKM